MRDSRSNGDRRRLWTAASIAAFRGRRRTDRLYTEGVIFVSNTAQTWDDFQAAYDLDTFDGDKDGDGFSNGLELLLGTNPVQSGSTSLLTRRSVVETAAATEASFQFHMPEWPAQDGDYRIAASSDLVHWTSIATKGGTAPWNTAAGATISATGAGTLQMTVVETLPAGTPRRFHRLEASEQ